MRVLINYEIKQDFIRTFGDLSCSNGVWPPGVTITFNLNS